MSCPKSDILVKIPDDQLPKLAALYEQSAQWAPYVISFVHMGIKWKKSQKYCNWVTFTSPNNTWEKDGTMVAILTCHCQDIFVFTLDQQTSSLSQGLIQTTRIDFGKRVHFLAIHPKCFPSVTKLIEERNLNISYHLPLCFFYGLPPEKGKNLTFECPPDVYVKKLDVSDAKQISIVYPHKFVNLEEYVVDFIEANGGYGVYLKSTNELVAWVVKHFFGHMGMLQTKEGHERKGYASLMVKALSKEIGEEGQWSSATVLTYKPGPINLLEQLGFQNLTNTSFITLENGVPTFCA